MKKRVQSFVGVMLLALVVAGVCWVGMDLMTAVAPLEPAAEQLLSVQP